MDTRQLLRLTAARRYAKSGAGRTLRQDAGLSLQEVAAAVGVALVTVYRWETGQRRPTGEPGALWADLLDQIKRDAEKAAA